MSRKLFSTLLFVVVAFVILLFFSSGENAFAAQCGLVCNAQGYVDYSTIGECVVDYYASSDDCNTPDPSNVSARRRTDAGGTLVCTYNQFAPQCGLGPVDLTCCPAAGCTATDPGVPTLNAPGNASILDTVGGTSRNVTLGWDPLADWGTGCPGNDNGYEVYGGTSPGSLSFVASTNSDTHWYTWNVTNTSGATYYWKVRAKNGSNYKESSVWSFKINNPPSIPVNPYPAPSSWLNFIPQFSTWQYDADGDNVRAQYSITSAGGFSGFGTTVASGSNSVWTPATLCDGNWTWTAQANDTRSGWSAFFSPYVTFGKDTLPPDSSSDLVNNQTYGGTKAVSLSSTDNWHSRNQDGTCTDKAGGSGTSNVYVFIDSTPPGGTCNNYTDIINGGSGIWNWDTTAYPNGSYTFKTCAKDIAGNAKVGQSITVNVSNITPTVTPISPNNGYVVPVGTTSVDLTANAVFNTFTNTRSAVIKISRDGGAFENVCSLNPAGDGNFTCNATGLIVGSSYDWKAEATNENGTTTSATWNFSVGSCVSDTPTTPTLLTPPDGSTQANPVGLDWTDSVFGNACGGNNNHYILRLGTNINPPIYQDPVNVSNFSFTGTPGTAYYWKIQASNGVITSDSTTWSFTVAQNATPTVTLVSPANGAVLPVGTTSTFLTANVVFNTNSGTRSVSIYAADLADGVYIPICSKNLTSDGNVMCSTDRKLALTDGHNYQWYATATNDYGITTSLSRTFSVDTPYLVPSVTLVSPANGTVLPVGTTSVDLTANAVFNTFTNTRSAVIKISRDGGAFENVCSLNPAGDGNFTCNATGLIVGSSYDWKAEATNENGTTTSATWNFSVNVPPILPGLTINSPIPPGPVNYDSGTTVSVNWTATDSDGNLSTTDLWKIQSDVSGKPYPGASWSQIGATQTCSGASCAATRNWIPAAADELKYWLVVGGAKDTTGGSCLGRPGGVTYSSYPDSYTASSADCGASDYVIVYVTTPCVAVSPSAFNLLAPADGSAINANGGGTVPVTLNWQAVSSWGKGCPIDIDQYKIYIGTTNPPAYYTAVGAGTTSFVYNAAPNNTYYWKVEANNGSLSAFAPTFGVWSFTVNPVYSISGKVWEVQNQCSDADRSKVPGINGSSNVTATATTGQIYTSAPLAGGAYTISNVPGSSLINTLCFSGSLNPPADQKYNLECYLSGSQTAIGNCFNLNPPLLIDSNKVSQDLGFGLESTLTGWYTTSGDVFGASFTSKLPDAPASEWSPDFLAYSGGNAFTSSLFDIGGAGKISESGIHAEKVDMSSLWLSKFSFDPPNDAITLTSFDNLDPDKVYKIDSSSFNSMISSDVIYKVKSNGVVVIYVTGNTKVVFSHNFTSQNKKRVILIARPSVEISDTLGAITVTKSTPANIQASIISKNNIVFKSSGTPVPSDLSIMVEGPLVAGNGASFNRNRGLANNYPGEVIDFINYYMAKLSLQERQSSVTNLTGLFVTDTYWQIQ